MSTHIFDWTVEGRLKYVLEPKTSNFSLTNWDNGHSVRVSLVDSNVTATLPSVAKSIGFYVRFVVCGVDPENPHTLTINNGTDPVSTFSDGVSNANPATKLELSSTNGVGQYVDVFSDGAVWSIHSFNCIKNSAPLAFEIDSSFDLTATSFTSVEGVVVSDIPSGSILFVDETSQDVDGLTNAARHYGKTFTLLILQDNKTIILKAAVQTVGIHPDSGVFAFVHNGTETRVSIAGKAGDMATLSNANGTWLLTASTPGVIDPFNPSS